MTLNQVYILSDTIRSGKTTAIKNWAGQKRNVTGFLSPEIDGKRVFQNIETCELIPMETHKNDLIVGKYAFDSKSFNHVENEILKEWKKARAGFIVLDEVGPLEIKKNLGFHKLLIELQKTSNSDKPNLLFVVRDNCLKAFLDKYTFENVHALTLEQFKKNFVGQL